MASLGIMNLSFFQIAISLMLMIRRLFGIAEINFYKRMLNFVEFHTNSQKSACSNQSPEEDGLDDRASA